MTKKMSKAALARCRSMKIVDESLDESYRVVLQVYDPKITPDKPVVEYSIRNKANFERIFIGAVRKYRVPRENIFKERVDGNAGTVDEGSSEVHESREEILGCESEGFNGKAAICEPVCKD
jgi:hypothetical protein